MQLKWGTAVENIKKQTIANIKQREYTKNSKVSKIKIKSRDRAERTSDIEAAKIDNDVELAVEGWRREEFQVKIREIMPVFLFRWGKIQKLIAVNEYG